MSLMIESTDELLELLKKMDLKVKSVDELRELLASINASYDPEATRQKTGKLIGITVPGYMAGAAAFASFMLLGSSGSTPFTVGSLGVIWGAVAVVSTAAVIAAAVMTSVRGGRTMPDNPSTRPASRGEPGVTHITKDLSI